MAKKGEKMLILADGLIGGRVIVHASILLT